MAFFTTLSLSASILRTVIKAKGHKKSLFFGSRRPENRIKCYERSKKNLEGKLKSRTLVSASYSCLWKWVPLKICIFDHELCLKVLKEALLLFFFHLFFLLAWNQVQKMLQMERKMYQWKQKKGQKLNFEYPSKLISSLIQGVKFNQ